MFNQYILILVWIGIMALIQKFFYREEYNALTGEYEWRVAPFFAILVMAPVVWMAANRGWFADTDVYIRSYQTMPDTFAGISGYMETISKDKGFSLFSAILRVIIGKSYVPYLCVIAIFQAYAVSKLFREHSIDYVLCVFLFIASTDYLSWMFNGIRQFMAVSIILLATPLMLKESAHVIRNKYLPLFVIIICASTMHQSALLMIPFVVIAQGEAWNRRTLLFLIGTLLAIAFVGRFTGLLDEVLSNTQYKNVVSDYTEWGDDGTNPLRVLVYSIPAIISFLERRTIKEENNPVINFCTNMSIVSMGIYIISMFTSGIFIGRLPIYASLYSYILLSWEIENLFEKSRSAIKITAIFGYLMFYYYQMHVTYGLF